MAIIRFKNNSGSSGTWVGQTISAGAYYEPELSELIDWRTDTLVFKNVGDGDLLVNKGADTTDDITNPVVGWNWALGNPDEKEEEEKARFVGGLRTKRLLVRKYSKNFTVPVNVSNLTIKNIGTTDACISFNTDTADDYFRLESKEIIKIIGLTSTNRLLKYIGDATTTLEIIMWG